MTPASCSGIVGGLLGRERVERGRARLPEARDRLAQQCEGVLVRARERVGHARDARVDVAPAELLGGHLLARRGLHERRTGQEDRAGALHDHALVAHRGDVGAPGRARAHHGRQLRNAVGRHARLVVEDAPEMVAVGEDLGLQRQVGAAGIDQVDARQAVLEGDLLCAQVLLDGQREVRAALDRGVVGDDHALAAVHRADAGDDARAGRLVLVHAEGRQRRELEPRGVGVEQEVDALAHRQLAAAAVALERARAAALARLRQARAQLVAERAHALLAAHERLAARIQVAGQATH